MADMVNHPDHYTTGGIEVIDVIEDWGLGFSLGNAVKYLCRIGVKRADTLIEDREKALWYIDRALAHHHLADMFGMNKGYKISASILCSVKGITGPRVRVMLMIREAAITSFITRDPLQARQHLLHAQTVLSEEIYTLKTLL